MKPFLFKSEGKIIFCLPDNCPGLDWAENKIKAIDNVFITWFYGLGDCSITASLGSESVRLIDDPMMGSVCISWQEDCQPQGLLLQIINIITDGLAQL